MLIKKNSYLDKTLDKPLVPATAPSLAPESPSPPPPAEWKERVANISITGRNRKPLELLLKLY